MLHVGSEPENAYSNMRGGKPRRDLSQIRGSQESTRRPPLIPPVSKSSGMLGKKSSHMDKDSIMRRAKEIENAMKAKEQRVNLKSLIIIEYGRYY